MVVTDLSAQKQNEAALREYAEQNARLSQELRDYTGVLEQRVQERTAELEQINRELEAFTYTVSHDLRAPLRAIDGFAQILIRSYFDNLPEKGQLFLNKIIENAADLSHLLDALLTLSRHSRKPLEKRMVKPAELVKQALAELQVNNRNDRLVVETTDMPACMADPILLKQVYVNLLSNAIKFSAGRSPAVIDVGWRTGAAQAETGASDGQEKIYYVRDNGVGLDLSKARNLFGVFQQYHDKKEYEGSGVGLAIVQRIIHRHGGRIWIESALGEGTTVFFTLSENAS
jgi:light-regulated signal transduction histidine kinase (bacteriophytochrome)